MSVLEIGLGSIELTEEAQEAIAWNEGCSDGVVLAEDELQEWIARQIVDFVNDIVDEWRYAQQDAVEQQLQDEYLEHLERLRGQGM